MTMKRSERSVGAKGLAKWVMALAEYGWHIPNIAHITGVNAGTVRNILQQQGVDVDAIAD